MKKIIHLICTFALSLVFFITNTNADCDILSVVGNTDICFNTSTSLTVTYEESCETNLTIRWMFGGFVLGTEATFDTPNLSNNITYMVAITSDDGNDSLEVEVTVMPPFTATLPVAPEFCSGGSVNLEPALQNGDSPFDYDWSNNSTASEITVFSSGLFVVTVTDESDCVAIAQSTVTAHSNPNAFFDSPIIESCDNAVGVEVKVENQTGSPPFSYQWSNGAMGNPIIVNMDGGYSVVVTDQEGCSDEASVQVILNEVTLSAFISPSSSTCVGENVTINAIAQGGTPSFNYNWNVSGSSSDQITITVLNDITVSVTITDDLGCEAFANTVINPNERPDVNAGQNIDLCPNGSTELNPTIEFPTMGPYGWLWSNGSTLEAPTVGPGIYTVTLTDGNGCTDEDTVTIGSLPAPTAEISSVNMAFCEGGSAVLLAEGGSGFNWSTNETTQEITVSNANSYTVIVSDGSGCTDAATINISLAQQPSVEVDGGAIICQFNSLPSPLSTEVIGGVGPISYSWEVSANGNGDWSEISDENDSSLDPGILNAIQLYQYRAKAAFNGPGNLNCPATYSEAENVDVVQKPNPEIVNNAFGQTFNFCQNQQTIISVNNPTSSNSEFDWWSDITKPGLPVILDTLNFGAVIWVHWGEVAGDYFIDVEETLGQGNSIDCSGIDEIQVVIGNERAPDPAEIFLTPINDILIYNDSTVTCYEWGVYDRETGFVNNLTNNTFQSFKPAEYKPENVYFCTVWNGDCSNPDCSTTAIFRHSAAPPSETPTEEEQKFNLYPNPNYGTFTLEVNKLFPNAEHEVQIFNSLGVPIHSETVFAQEDKIVLEIESKDRTAGVYYLALRFKGEVQQVKGFVINPN